MLEIFARYFEMRRLRKETRRLREAAEQGDVYAQFDLGWKYFRTEHDNEEAVRWFREAAEQGHAQAQCYLGVMCRNAGHAEEAARWFRKAAEQGHADAQYYLGDLYDHGFGLVSEDGEEAMRWFREAAAQGDDLALQRLRKAAAQGHAEAKWWLRRAAEQGHAKAQYHVGCMYVEGRGLPQHDVLAYAWFNIAAAQGDEDAREAKSSLAKRLTPEQVAEAQRTSHKFAAQIVQ